MRYGSVCSGIEAATVAWEPLGWKPAFYSEIEKFPCAVLQHHYPDVANRGDMTRYQEWPDEPIDLLVGGTPCQSFSVAGLRKGISDPRGNLALVYLGIADRYRPRWVVWENVPGVLSSGGGRDFGSFLGGLAELGYGWSYRILDAQYFGVPQRRRRVFVVGYLGDWRRAAAVLFERESLSGNPPPSRGKREGFAPAIAPSLRAQGNASHRLDSDAYVANSDTVPRCLNAGACGWLDAESETFIAFGAQNSCTSGLSASHDHTPTLDKSKVPAVAFGVGESPDVGHCLRSGASKADKHESTTYVAGSSVRRLTPTEYERLQGFPDGYTDIQPNNKSTPDGPRYKALGNSMAVPVMRWIGERIQMVEET